MTKAISTRRNRLQVLPKEAVRAGLVSLVVVITSLALLDHVLLAYLERQGYISGIFWESQNRLVAEEHASMDATELYKIRKGLLAQISDPQAGVRAWTRSTVSKAKTKPRRILVMGDSFIWGSPYLTLNHFWWRQLALELDARGYGEVEVIAAGDSGLSTAEQLQLAKQVVPEYAPDLVIWGYVTNDCDEYLVPYERPLPPEFPGRTWLHFGMPRIMRLLEQRRVDKCQLQNFRRDEQRYDSYTAWELKLLDGANFARYRDTVRQVGEFQRSSGIPGILVTLPNSPSREYFECRYRPILPLWTEAGIRVYDLMPAFVEKFGDVSRAGPAVLAWGINPGDGHPGPRACRFLALQTAERLERDYPHVLGALSTSRAATMPAINDWLPASLDVKPDTEFPPGFLLTYPRNKSRLVTTNLGTATALVALETPMRLSEVILSGPDLRGGRVWISSLDREEGFDDQQWLDLGHQAGAKLQWKLPPTAERKVSVIRFVADMNGAGRKLKLQLLSGEETSQQP